MDPEFSNVLGGLILVDLVQTEPALLAKYMGSEAAAKFRALYEAAAMAG